MRSSISVICLFMVIGLAGCGQSASTPADEQQSEAPAQVEHEAISDEDFESGQAGEMVASDGEDEGSETQAGDETP